MASHYVEPNRGIRKSSAVITIAAAATPQNLYLLSVGGTNPRTVIIRKIIAYSNVGNCVIDIGTGLGGLFARAIPSILAVGGFDNEWTEDEIPEIELPGNLTVQSDVLGCQVQVEVEERGS